MRQCRSDGIARAALAGLMAPAAIGVGQNLPQLIAAMAVHDYRPGAAAGLAQQGIGQRQHVANQRLAAERLQDLGQGRAHALALSGGQDDDLQR